MIYPKKNIIFKFILDTYVRWLTARHFHQINYNQANIHPDRAILLVANHFSAWDTFVLYHINHKLFKKKFHAMILEKTVKKQPILKYAGAFSVNKSSRDVMASLDFAAKLLDDPQNLVLIFPQGKLYSNMVTEVLFERGLARILKTATGKFDLIFAATFLENFEHFKTVANVHLKAESPQNFSDIEALQQAYQQHYTTSRLQQTQIIKQ